MEKPEACGKCGAEPRERTERKRCPQCGSFVVGDRARGALYGRCESAHRIPIEEDKAANERGYYLHPDAFGLPQSKAIAMTNGVQPTTNSSAAFAMPGDGQVSHFIK